MEFIKKEKNNNKRSIVFCDFLQFNYTKKVSEKKLLEKFHQQEAFSKFWGVYETREEVLNDFPILKANCYQKTEEMVQNSFKDLNFNLRGDFDYPNIVYLLDILSKNKINSLVDFGGTVGRHYYTCKLYIPQISTIEWNVVELPSCINVGRKIATDLGAQNLKFTDDIDNIKSAEVLLTSGTLQYLDNDLISSILSKNYEHIIINRTPFSKRNSFYSAQNMGDGIFSVHQVFNFDNFTNTLNSLGYEIVAQWKEYYDGVYFLNKKHSQKSGPVNYMGFYLRKIH